MTRTLPGPVERWLTVLGGTAEAIDTAVLQGRARFRRQGKGLWLPIEAMMWHELGRNHVADLRVGLGPLTVVRGLDGYLDGVGFSRISHTLDMGPEIDQSAALSMWAEAILFPRAWRDRDDLAWTSIDGRSAQVSLPSSPAAVNACISFDDRSGFPRRFEAERYKGIGSRATEWIVDYTDWRPTADGVMLPGLATVTWSDEPGPWFRTWIERANPGADVSDAMARGRSVLARAAGDPTRAPR